MQCETEACLNGEVKPPSFGHVYHICRKKSGLYCFTPVFEPQHWWLLSQCTAELKMVETKVLYFPSNFWPDLCRGNTEKEYTQAKKESLSSESWRWNMSHIGISLFPTAVKIKMVLDSFRLFPSHSLAFQSLHICCCSSHFLQLNPAIIQ